MGAVVGSGLLFSFTVIQTWRFEMNLVDLVKQDKELEEMIAQQSISWPQFIIDSIRYALWVRFGEWKCEKLHRGHDIIDLSVEHANYKDGGVYMECQRCGRSWSGNWSG
jgi:hypothetical protein